MIVKIRDIIINTEDEPALLVLSDQEKELISNMGPQKKFCSFPDEMTEEEVTKFMTEHPDDSKWIF